MIVGIGCDVVEHKMTKQLQWTSDADTRDRVFSYSELELYNQSKTLKFLTGRFAAKEAVLKCLGTGMYDGISLKEIQILNGKSGEPVLEVLGEVKKLADSLGIDSWYVSISHSPTSSFAVVIAERREG